MRTRSCLAFVLLASAPWAGAADKEGNYAVWGPGQRSCNQYMESREAGSIEEFKLFAMGYMTAYNTFVPETYRNPSDLDVQGVLEWLDKYCDVTRVDSFERALKLMMEHFHPTRQGHAPTAGRGGW